MDKETRNRIQKATQQARSLLENEYAMQLEGKFDIRLDGAISSHPGDSLSPAERILRGKLVAAIEHRRSSGITSAEAVEAYLREAAFTTLNRFVALKMLEARELVQECVSRGELSSGYNREFTGLAPGLAQLPDHGYRLYIESLFDEIGREVGILFDRRDPASLLWPRRQPLHELLETLNARDLDEVWGEDETIGWVYQYFNSDEDRKKARYNAKGKPKPPQNSYELAVRNQFFTPRYVVEFLTDNTLGRTWYEMQDGSTSLATRCAYLVTSDEPLRPREKKDPRSLRILDPACGSGHFLLYAFDLLLEIYDEAWASSELELQADFPTTDDLRRAAPGLILKHNLFGVDIDPRAAQIAALSLWMRAQRAFADLGLPRTERPTISRTNIVVAEPMPGDLALRQELIESLDHDLGRVVERVFHRMELAGEMGSLLEVESEIRAAIRGAHEETGSLFRTADEELWSGVEQDLLEALGTHSERAQNGKAYRRRLFSGDATRGLAFIDLCRQRYDVVLMNPPFGAVSPATKLELQKSYPRSKQDFYAAFVERGVQLLHPRGMLGAITSRTGFFLSSFQRWREEVILEEAPPVVFADLGHGVMDSAMVEAAAYCLEKAS